MKRKSFAFSAVLLAGGRSTRMGRDKASLLIDHEPLWARQLATLRATGASELLISGRADGPFKNAGARIIEDLTPDAGPLAALEAILPVITTTHLVVLAIDLPAMRADFLSGLVEIALAENCCVVPAIDGRFEPLAGIYTPRILPHVLECLHSTDRSMQGMLRKAEQAQVVIAHAISPEERALFRNLNSPRDLPPTPRECP